MSAKRSRRERVRLYAGGVARRLGAMGPDAVAASALEAAAAMLG